MRLSQIKSVVVSKNLCVDRPRRRKVSGHSHENIAFPTNFTNWGNKLGRREVYNLRKKKKITPLKMLSFLRRSYELSWKVPEVWDLYVEVYLTIMYCCTYVCIQPISL